MHTPASPIIQPRPLAAEDIRAEILQALTGGLTGQIQVLFLQREKSLTLFAVNGKVQQVYVRNHRIPDMNWVIPLFEYGKGELSIKPLPQSGLLLKKVILESTGNAEPQPSNTAQLKSMFDLAEQNTTPSLFRIRWDTAEGLVLVAGKDISLRRAVMMTMSESMEGPGALNQITAWSEAGCRVTMYRGNIQSQAWFEAHLNILFEHYCSAILNQYGQLSGKVMIRAIVWKIHTMAVNSGWNLDTHNNEIKDATIFSNARRAGDTYKNIIAEIVSHIEPIIGRALTQNILMQTYNSTKGVYKTIAEVFDLLGLGKRSL